MNKGILSDIAVFLHYHILKRVRPSRSIRKALIDCAAGLRNSGAMSVLDFGCGEGVFTDIFRDDAYVGIDNRVCAVRFARQRGSRRAKFCAGNEKLCFRDSVFDCVLVCCVLHHMQPAGINVLFEEAARVLKPSGRLLIVDILPRNQQAGFFYQTAMWLEERIKRIRYFTDYELSGFNLLSTVKFSGSVLLVYSPAAEAALSR